MTKDCNLTQKRSVKAGEGEIILAVEGISKKFCRQLRNSLAYGLRDVGRELLGMPRHWELRSKEFWALKDINLQLQRGEALGMVGVNGAGKSTLLRIISGLIKPDTGRVRVRGSLAPLIALGAGFSPVLTGRENIYANMAILGLSTRQIKARLDEVVEFAEISDAIDAPVQTYSSGMAARLGFACAIHTEPDILLIDEVLAVGDVRFRIKCHQRLAKLQQKGTAFIMVSHNPHTLFNTCDAAVYLKQGRVVAWDETDDVLRRYGEDLGLEEFDQPSGVLRLPPRPREQSSGLDILSICFRNSQGELLEVPRTGEAAVLCVECQAYEPLEDLNLGVKILSLSMEQQRLLDLTSVSDNRPLRIRSGRVELRLKMDPLGLVPGHYQARIYIKQGVFSHHIVKSYRFAVRSDRLTIRSAFYQPRSWTVSMVDAGSVPYVQALSEH